MAMIPDVSHHRPITDWSKVKSNVSFLISKATQGTSFIDDTLDSFIKGCEANKIPYYLYSYLDKGNELAQAKFLVRTCKPKIGAYFRGYVLDVEAGNTVANVKEALNYISGESGRCMLYIGYKDYSKYKDIIDHLPSNCALWEARYGLNTGTYDKKYPPHDKADLHQYTSKGVCPGIAGFITHGLNDDSATFTNGGIDLNRLHSDKALSWYTSMVSIPSATKPVSYYKKYTGLSTRIDTVFKKIGVPEKYRGSYTKRRAVARVNGYSGDKYVGTAEQNLTLIAYARKGKLRKP